MLRHARAHRRGEGGCGWQLGCVPLPERTPVSTSHPVRCTLAQGRMITKCTLLQMSRQPQSAIPVHTHHKPIQVPYSQ